MHRVMFTGRSGLVRWGYYTAVDVGPWTMHAGTAGGALTATVVSHDAFRVSQQPLTFVVARPNGHAWTWPVLTLQIVGTSLSAELGPQE